MLKLFEMFAGYGGASFALSKAGIEFECVGYSEIDKNAIKIYNLNHPNRKNYGDCRNINPDKLPDFDLLTAGFPCQPFSVAGRRKGTEDDRYLWPEMFRVIQLYKPTWVIAENVRGLTTWNDGMVLETVCTDLEGEGYEVQPFIIPSASISPYFMYTQLSLMYEHLRAMGRGGNQENLNLGMIKSLDVLVPPKADIDKFLSIRQRADAMLTKARLAEENVERLALSLMFSLLG
jgi:hypothetical protein